MGWQLKKIMAPLPYNFYKGAEMHTPSHPRWVKCLQASQDPKHLPDTVTGNSYFCLLLTDTSAKMISLNLLNF